MQLNLDTRNWNQEDVDILTNNLEEIIKYGMATYNKKHNKKLTKTETIMFNIFKDNINTCLKSEDILNLYNKQVYGNNKKKYVKQQNVTTKINRMNRKLKGVKIVNRFGYGYYLVIC